jgi:hypothetical protein
MQTRNWPRSELYALNLTLLSTHQVNAGFWHEWELFGVPGGLPGFLSFNVAAVGLLSVGLSSVSRLARTSRFWERLCAAVGVVTLILHAGLALRRDDAFCTPASIALFVGIGITSVFLLLGSRPRVTRPDSQSLRS